MCPVSSAHRWAIRMDAEDHQEVGVASRARIVDEEKFVLTCTVRPSLVTVSCEVDPLAR